MNIALVGYGKMGREIERFAPEHGVTIVEIFHSKNNKNASGLTKASLKNADVCIDVSTPQAVMANIKALAQCKKNVVVGATGWYDRIPEVAKLTAKSKIGLLYASNFSIGMNIFYQCVELTAGLCDQFHYYDVAISETHHTQKLDSPSATALTLAQTVMKNFKEKERILKNSPDGKIKREQLQVASLRLGKVVGNHRVMFDSEADTIELIHNAKNRSGFAHGALIAAKWLNGKKGIFTMKDVITSIL